MHRSRTSTSTLLHIPANTPHKHPKDEFFLVLEGELQLGFGDRTVHLAEGEGLMVRKGTIHKPYAKDRALVLKVEPQDFPFEIV